VIDPLSAFVVGYTPAAEQSVNGVLVTKGGDLSAASIIGALDPLAVSFSDPMHGVLVGSPTGTGASIYVTTDGGRQWVAVTP
jgi:photosystem II stability/assembly factor-like uncharacterized protein